VGRGFLAVDFATLDVDMAMRHDKLERGLRTVRSALGHDPIDPGKRLYPSRFQREGIPMWGAAATSIESLSLFAKAGMGIMLNPYTRSPEEVGKAIAIYHEMLASAGHPPTKGRVLIHEHLYAAESERLAEEVPRSYLMKYLAALREASCESSNGSRTEHSAGPENYKVLFPQHVAFGTPSQLRDRISQWTASGVTDFAFSFRFGGLPSDVVAGSLELFAKEVIPYFRNGDAKLAAE